MIIETDLVPESPLKDYLLQEEMLDDANSVDHLKVVRLLFESICDLEGKFLSHYGEGLNEYRKSLMLAGGFHDYHEGIVGDAVNKTQEFKLKELIAMQTCFDTDLKDLNPLSPLYVKQIQDAYYILMRDPKIKSKYQIDDNTLRLMELKVSNLPVYSQLGEAYEDMHLISFMLATCSDNRTTLNSLTMLADVIQNNTLHLFEMSKKSPFCQKLAYNLFPKIKAGLQLLRNEDIRANLESWDRKVKSHDEIKDLTFTSAKECYQIMEHLNN
jgi:hypothetical protein